LKDLLIRNSLEMHVPSYKTNKKEKKCREKKELI
jgi:hypothetical protein